MNSRNVCSNNCNCDCNTDYLPPCPPCGDIPLPPTRPCPPVPGCGPNPPGCSNHTPNYGLPLWKASDVTSWLMQMNGAMLRIDTILHDLALRTGINGLPDDLVTAVSKLCQDYEVLKCTVSEMGNKQANLELLMQNLNTQVSSMKTDVSAMGISITNFDTRLMSQESAAGAMRNDITLIKSDMNMLNKTLNNLTSMFTQFQQTVTQELAELKTGKAPNVVTRLAGYNTETFSQLTLTVDSNHTVNSDTFSGQYFDMDKISDLMIYTRMELPNNFKTTKNNTGKNLSLTYRLPSPVEVYTVGSSNFRGITLFSANDESIPVTCKLELHIIDSQTRCDGFTWLFYDDIPSIQTGKEYHVQALTASFVRVNE